MGVYISNKDSFTFIDGLHTNYNGDYLFPTTSLLNKINKQLPRDAMLSIKYTGDHFMTSLANAYLAFYQNSFLFESDEIIKAIKTAQDRLFTIHTKDCSKQTIAITNFKITELKINHVGKRRIATKNVRNIVNVFTNSIRRVGYTNWMEEIHLFNQSDGSDQ